MSGEAICKLLKVKHIPKGLVIYMFCSPSLNGELRCLPREGGYLDQDNIDILNFQIIEGRVFNWQRRQSSKPAAKPAKVGNKRTVTIPFKDL